MTQYSAEVQRILDTPIVDPDVEGVPGNDRWDSLVTGSRDKFWRGVDDYHGDLVADAAVATEYRDEISQEDYVWLMTPWWKATGKTVEDEAHPSFATGGIVTPDDTIPAGYSDCVFPSPVLETLAQMWNKRLPTAESAPKAPRRATLEEAANLIDGDRNAIYGEPLDNHKRIADLWAAGVFGHPITPAQVAIAMALVKVARLVHTPDHHDSYVDGAAYLAIADELRDA